MNLPRRTAVLLSAGLCAALGALAVVPSSDLRAQSGERLFAHDVYFSLADASPAARQKLVDACRMHLSSHPGTVFFAAGTRAESQQREVNDRGFDVSLHVYFASQAAHDAYQEHPRHKRFIEEMGGNWKTVRVFDSWVESSR